jgi:hypothetical protein
VLPPCPPLAPTPFSLLVLSLGPPSPPPQDLPRNAAVRKVNELVKRARMARVHAIIIGHLKAQMPFFGQASKQKQLLDNLADEFFAVMKKHRLPQGDFPNIQRFKDVASTYDFGKFKKLDDRVMQSADDALTSGIPTLLRQLAEENDAKAAADKAVAQQFMGNALTGGAAPGMGGGGDDDSTGEAGGAGASASAGNPFGGAGVGGRDPYAIWAALVNKVEADSVFRLLPGGQEGLVSGAGARDVLMESAVDTGVLRTIWDLSDVDRDGYLDADEFALCWYLIQQAKAGQQIPGKLPANLLPPSKRSA